MKYFYKSLFIVLVIAVFAGCSQSYDQTSSKEEKGIIVEPPDFPSEFNKALIEYEDVYEKAQTDSSYKKLLAEKQTELYSMAGKYNIKILSDEELSTDDVSSDLNNSRNVSTLNSWLNSIWGYYSDGAAYVNWDVYDYASYYEIYQKAGSSWVLWATLTNPLASGFVNRNARRFNIRCTNTSGQIAAKDLSV